jgi:hypothetical protein
MTSPPPEIGPATRVRVADNVHRRPFGDEIVLLDFARGEYFALDPVGAEMFELLASGESIESVAAAIVRRYDVALEVAVNDIVVLVTRLNGHGLVTVL